MVPHAPISEESQDKPLDGCNRSPWESADEEAATVVPCMAPYGGRQVGAQEGEQAEQAIMEKEDA
eukprot:13440669-Alexandrium_andersonii.AAC.1